MVYSYINEQNKKAVEGDASAAAERNSLSFLPILEEGDALIIGVGFPIPFIVKINAPTIKTDSSPLSSQNGIIRILILANSLLYPLFANLTQVADYPPEYLRNIIWNRKLTKMKTQDSMCTLPPQSCL